MNYGLSDNDLNNIIEIISANKKIDEILLFGSRAKGNFKPGSDVDLALKGENLNLGDLTGLLNSIDDLFLPYTFDLVIYDRITEEALTEHVKRKGISLFKRDKVI